LENGADVNAPPFARYGATALQFAAIGGYIGIAQPLIQRGANVNASAAKIGGRTALEGAAEHGRIDILQLLLSAGAQISGPGKAQYDRSLELALKNGHRAACRLLEKYRMDMLENCAILDDATPLKDVTPLENFDPLDDGALLEDVTPAIGFTSLDDATPFDDMYMGFSPPPPWDDAWMNFTSFEEGLPL
jgi:ankyrin repeat protein